MTATTHLMTAEELLNLDGPYRHELVKGELLTMPLPGFEHGAVTARLSSRLAVYVDENQLGAIVVADTGFTLERNPDTVLGPDIAFIRSGRITKRPAGYLELAPDLVVEVISPSQSRPEVQRRASQWLEYGVLEVWLVYPRTRTVEVRRATGEKQLLREGDDLTGGDLVPGFRIPVSEIFS